MSEALNLQEVEAVEALCSAPSDADWIIEARGTLRLLLGLATSQAEKVHRLRVLVHRQQRGITICGRYYANTDAWWEHVDDCLTCFPSFAVEPLRVGDSPETEEPHQ